MAINFTGNVVFIDAPGTGIILPASWIGRLSRVIVVGGTAAGLLKIYAAQSAVAARQVFEGTGPVAIAEAYDLVGSEDSPSTYQTQNGFFADLSGAGAKAFIYLG